MFYELASGGIALRSYELAAEHDFHELSTRMTPRQVFDDSSDFPSLRKSVREWGVAFIPAHARLAFSSIPWKC